MTEKFQYKSIWLPDLLGVLLLTALATLPFLTPAPDMVILSTFHHAGMERPWPHEFDFIWSVLYHVGTWPALITALTGLGIVVASLYKARLVRWRRHAALIFLTLVLGPGLFVNTIFKDHWGRPRPRQVTEFGGTMTYRCFYEQGVPGRGKSFPCGHSSMGYYFAVFYFLLRRRHMKLAMAVLAGSLAYGTLIGMARMAAGAHFASDVLWSAVFPIAVAWLLYYVILRIPQSEDVLAGTVPPPSSRFRWMGWFALPLAGAAIVAVMVATPAHTELNYHMAIPEKSNVIVRVNCNLVPVHTNTSVTANSDIIVKGEVSGFGWPWSRIRHSACWTRQDNTWILNITVSAKGRLTEPDGAISIQMPPCIPIQFTP